MDFGAPLHLLLLAPLGALAVLLRRAERGRSRDLATFGDLPLLSRASNLPGVLGGAVRRTLLVGGLALVVVALAAPRTGEGRVAGPRAGRDLLFVLDLSRSMEAADVAPSRLEAARRAIRRILAASPADRAGLAVFAASAFLQLPPTEDRAAFEQAIGEATTEDIPDPGSDLGQGLTTAAATFSPRDESSTSAVILFSDGENLEGDLEGGIAALARRQVPVVAIGVGTPVGGRIPEPEHSGGGWHADAEGRLVITRLDETTLRRIAGATGGRYLRLEAGRERETASAVVRALRGIARRRAEVQRRTGGPDRYQFPLAAGLGALAAASLLPERCGGRQRLRRISARRHRRSAALLAGLLAGATVPNPPGVAAQEPATAERLYRSGHFHEALEAFQALSERSSPERLPALEYNSGNALFRLGRYEAAALRYRRSLRATADLRQRSWYNLGTALVRSGRPGTARRDALRQAVAAYERALVENPSDSDAKWNLEVAIRRLEEDERWRSFPMRREGPGASAGGNEEEGALTAGNAAPGSGGGAISGAGQGPERLRPVPELTRAEARQLVRSARGEEERPEPEAAARGSRPAKPDW